MLFGEVGGKELWGNGLMYFVMVDVHGNNVCKVKTCTLYNSNQLTNNRHEMMEITSKNETVLGTQRKGTNINESSNNGKG